MVGGSAGSEDRSDGEAFDLESRTWQALPPMAGARHPDVVVVAGGLVAAVAKDVNAFDDEEPALARDELFDEASGRWFELPHRMAERRTEVCAVSLPASALAPPAEEGAAAAAGPAGAAAAGP